MSNIHNAPSSYSYRVTWSEEDSEYVALCAEFPSLSWLAGTPDRALAGIQRLVEDVLSDMDESGGAAA